MLTIIFEHNLENVGITPDEEELDCEEGCDGTVEPEAFVQGQAPAEYMLGW